MIDHLCITGDCIEVMRDMPSESIDLVIVDPPYNRGLNYGGLYDDNKDESEYIIWCKMWLSDCIRLLNSTGSLYMINYPENAALLYPFLKKFMHFNRWITWCYPTNIGQSTKNYTRSQRAILFCSKTDKYKFNREDILQPYKNPEDKRIKALIENGSGGRAPYDVFYYNMVKNVSKDKTEHPCQIPEPLLEVFIKASSDRGDVVLDPLAGSFSTCAVAKRLGRKSIGIDINPDYVKIGSARLAEIQL
jgi:DNA modification methylase